MNDDPVTTFEARAADALGRAADAAPVMVCALANDVLALAAIFRHWRENTVLFKERLSETHSALAALAADYEQLMGDGLTHANEPAALARAHEVLGAHDHAGTPEG